ncbi:hypothetical protein [Mycobacterium tilburgii]|uniref:hypothetical protein n=1 Tax=Mycobacterium tilburgii TaxID=44467 RepID=UPI0021B2AEC2
MRTVLPAERRQRRLGADPYTDSPAQDPDSGADEDQNSLLPRWLPNAVRDQGWVA